MKALVTGGLGFIGGAVARHLLREGYDVWLLDNMYDPTMTIQSGMPNSMVNLHTIDVADLSGLKELSGDIDTVFHFAGHYANVRSLEEPMESIKTNMLGTMAILEFCREREIKKLMYASSSGVYGAKEVVAYSESSPPKPSTPYEVGKYSGELLCSGFCEIFDINLIAPRFFNVYGPGDVPGKYRAVIPKFFQTALKGDPLVVTGKMVSRDFTYIDDVVAGIMAGMRRMDEAPDRIELVYNIGTGTEVFITELAETIKKVTKSESEVLVEELRFWDNAPRRVADTHKYRALFPKQEDAMRSVEKGLEDAADWYMEVRN